MKMGGLMLWLLVIAGLTAPPPLVMAQSPADSRDSSSTVASTSPAELDLTYVRPPPKTKLRNYLFDAFGPYPIVGATFTAGFDQARKMPGDWGEAQRVITSDSRPTSALQP